MVVEDAAGAGPGAVPPATTSTRIFMPLPQCPVRPQRKYRVPAAVSGTTSLPVRKAEMLLALEQASYPASVTSTTSCSSGEYANVATHARTDHDASVDGDDDEREMDSIKEKT